jgi:hypothetical protein
MLIEEMDYLFEHVGNLQGHGRGWTANCPNHNDRHSSLIIDDGGDGMLVLYCFAGCTFAQICNGLGFPNGHEDLRYMGSLPRPPRSTPSKLFGPPPARCCGQWGCAGSTPRSRC